MNKEKLISEIILLKQEIKNYKYEIAKKQLELDLINSDIADAKHTLDIYQKNIFDLSKQKRMKLK